MKTLSFRRIGIALFFALVLFSCKKEGIGGQFDLLVTVKHHDDLIPGAIVYIKYGAREFPGHGPENYDDSAVCDTEGPTLGQTHFKGLRKGNYYLYSRGWDAGVNENVIGGVPVHIKDKTGNKSVLVPVSEETGH